MKFHQVDSYIFANIILLVYELLHFQTELLVDPLQLVSLVLDLLQTETRKINDQNYKSMTNIESLC